MSEMENVELKPAVAEGAVISSGAAGPGLAALAGILGTQSDLHIKQRIAMVEAATGGCCEKNNIYHITSGSDGQGEMLLEAKEESKCINRMCCKPAHSRTTYIYPVGMTKEAALLTVDHPGVECILCTAPKPCLGCFACTDCCLDGVNVYDGYVEGEPGHLEGGNLISAIKMPVMGGGCTPTLVVDDKAYVEGPMCFGGWSELCCESSFKYSTTQGGGGDIAEFKHLRPKDCGGVCRELCTDSDNFGVTFAPGATAEQKADSIAAALLVDYMFFEIDAGMCYYDQVEKACKFTCFLCYCYGCLCPCTCTLKGNDNNGGGGGGSVTPETMVGAPLSAEATEDVTAQAPMERTA